MIRKKQLGKLSKPAIAVGECVIMLPGRRNPESRRSAAATLDTVWRTTFVVIHAGATAMANRSVTHYDALDNIVFVNHPTPVNLETPQDVIGYFDAILDFFKRECNKSAYWLIDYTHLSTNPDVSDVYMVQLQRCFKELHPLGLFRCNGGVAQRTTGRMVSAKMQMRSHIYATQAQAIQAIRRARKDAASKTG
jgi:hypothetical protein